jgi:hypothetical protein
MAVKNISAFKTGAGLLQTVDKSPEVTGTVKQGCKKTSAFKTNAGFFQIAGPTPEETGVLKPSYGLELTAF